MSHPYWPADPTAPPPQRKGMGLGVGAALGVLVGLIGPVLIGLLAWGATEVLPYDVAGPVVSVLVILVLGLPVLFLLAGCLLMIPDTARGWGVAALMASGVWLVSSAGVCTVWLFGALATYDNAGMMLL